MDPALGVIKDLLEKYPTLKDRTVLTVNEIILLLEFCLKNMYFSFQDQFYEQDKGAPVRSMMGLTSRVPQAPSPLPMKVKLKPRVI